ncbi:hypothetical protein NE848_05805 [Gramella jeungdoensis]|uniref:Uncharacterized protein n=1 Tax=Gramella jeungdoensis TaxID=708091 RepID=A0ABT0YZH9_9FLAO|nr:hypothetical protein [Gramella jeungdoensis]
MHNDINRYRKEVKELQENNSYDKEAVMGVLTTAKKLEEGNHKILGKIDDRKSEIERFYREIAGSSRRIKANSEEIDSIKNKIENDKHRIYKLEEDGKRLNAGLIEQKEKNLKLGEEITKLQKDLNGVNEIIRELRKEDLNLKETIEIQANQIYTHKLLIIGGGVLIAFILLLTILL